MFFNDIQLVIKKCLYFWMWKLDVKMKIKLTTLNDSKNFTIIFDDQFDINEKQLRNFWDYFRLSDFFSSPSKIFFYFLTQWHHQTFISFAQYIYIYSSACNHVITIYKKHIKMKNIIKLEFYLRLQNTENFVLIASRSKIGDTPIVLVSFHIFQISSSVLRKLNRFFILEINFCGGSILAEINFWNDKVSQNFRMEFHKFSTFFYICSI